MSSSPTSRSKQKLEKEGWMTAVVERWNPHAKVRQDLYSFIDILAASDNELLAVQATSGCNVSARVEKIYSLPNFRRWIASPTRRVQVWGWRKVGAKGKRKTWQVRILELTTTGAIDLSDTATQRSAE